MYFTSTFVKLLLFKYYLNSQRILLFLVRAMQMTDFCHWIFWDLSFT